MKTFVHRSCMISILPWLILSAVPPASAGGAAFSHERAFKQPPYYRGTAPEASANVAVLVVAPSGPTEMPSNWLPISSLQTLTDEIEALVVDQGFPSASIATGRDATPPQISFGCAMDGIGECDREIMANVLVSTGGTATWKAEAARALEAAGADYLLVVQLRLEPRWIHQKNFSGKKEVRLGTNYSRRLPWLTSLESPVWVVQVTGALVDRRGKIVRSGAEGIWAVRTPFKASMARAEMLMNDSDIEFVRNELVREDLPHRPLGWRAAVDQLIHGLRHEIP